MTVNKQLETKRDTDHSAAEVSAVGINQIAPKFETNKGTEIETEIKEVADHSSAAEVYTVGETTSKSHGH